MKILALIMCLLALTAAAQQTVRVAECENGKCVMTEEMFRRVMESLEHWYAKAHEEKRCI